MSIDSAGYVEVINKSIKPVFANANDYDVAFYTDTSNQCIHFGVNANMPTLCNSTMRLTRSNLAVSGDIVTDKRLVLSGLRIDKRYVQGQDMNVTATINNSVDHITSLTNSVAFNLKPGQNEFRFMNNNAVNVFSFNEYGQILANNNQDSAQIPAISWKNNSNTGIYYAGSNSFGFSSAGTSIALFHNNGITCSNIYGSNLFFDGDIRTSKRMSLNGLRISRRANDGIEQNTTTVVSSIPCVQSLPTEIRFIPQLSTQQQFIFTSSNATTLAALTTTGQFTLGSNDSSYAPGFSWDGDSNTGMYHAAKNVIGFASGGTVVATLSNTTATFSNVTASNVNVLGVILMNSNDSSNAPGFSWNGDSNTGMYHAAKNVIGFASGGNLVATMSNTTATFSNVTTSNVTANATSSTLTTPSYSWQTDTDTGMYIVADNTIGFSCGGSNAMTLSTSTMNINGYLKQGLYYFFHGEDQNIGAEPGTAITANFRGNTTYTLVLATITNLGNIWNNNRVNFPIPGLYHILMSAPITSISGRVVSECKFYNTSNTLQYSIKAIYYANGSHIINEIVRISNTSVHAYATFSIYLDSVSSCRINYQYTQYAPYVKVTLINAI